MSAENGDIKQQQPAREEPVEETEHPAKRVKLEENNAPQQDSQADAQPEAEPAAEPEVVDTRRKGTAPIKKE
ncbi:hypothetical protein KEM55_003541 [Ascosphaera atra]|nr:hypothetical protein KEM55_003541 [Ascosphaera atra]